MARGRVGGTKSKISGKVGNEIYEIRSNGDGTISQIVSAMPESREDNFTPVIIRQRIIMSCLHKYMHHLGYILNHSLDGQLSKSLNLQHFVHYNVPILREVLDYGPGIANGMWFCDYGDTGLYPAPVRIAGDYDLPTFFSARQFRYSLSNWSLRLQLHHFQPYLSIEDYMQAHNHKVGDIGISLIQVVDSDSLRNRIYIMRLILNPKVRYSTKLTPDTFPLMFDIDSECGYEWSFNYSEQYEYYQPEIVVTKADCANELTIGAWGEFMSAYRNGLWRRGSGQLSVASGVVYTTPIRKTLEDVWPSWYTDRLKTKNLV